MCRMPFGHRGLNRRECRFLIIAMFNLESSLVEDFFCPYYGKILYKQGSCLL